MTSGDDILIVSNVTLWPILNNRQHKQLRQTHHRRGESI